ncbi:MAG: DUF1697 domain-containing protein, partial [Ktedonobacterales bacterium]
GINVGGHQVKMERLRDLFAELSFTGVRTYIQSGNVFFESPRDDRAALTSTIEQHLRTALGYDVPVFLRTVPELERILDSDPFHDLTVTSDMRLCIMFTAAPIAQDLALPLASPKKDIVLVHTTDHEAFVVWYLIDGRPPASSSFLSKALGARTTTRFFHTTAKILAAARNA